MKLKREANSFQNTSSAAPTSTTRPQSGSSNSARRILSATGWRAGHHARSTANGARRKVAAPRSNKAPISSAGTMRQGRKNDGAPLKTASARRTTALSRTNATSSTRSAARREGTSAASIERHARDKGKDIRGAIVPPAPLLGRGPRRPRDDQRGPSGLKLLGRCELQDEVHAENLLGALDLRGQPRHSDQARVQAAGADGGGMHSHR